MFDIYELFRQAQGGAAFDNLARAHGMSPEQMRAMTAALTPAFAQGFQRQAQSDDAARRLAELFQTETYARAFEAQAAALDPATRGAGEDALGALFGSKEVSRAVAQQAAAASGVQAEIIRKVLPVLASILVGGFMKAFSGAAPAAASAPGGGAFFPGPFGEMWSQMAGAGRAAGPQPDSAAANPFRDWMESLARAGGGSGAGVSGNPMGDMMAEMLKGMFGATAPEPATQRSPSPEPRPAPEEPPAGTGDASRPGEPATAFDDLVETGRELSAQNARAMERIFDAFFGGGAPKR